MMNAWMTRGLEAGTSAVIAKVTFATTTPVQMTTNPCPPGKRRISTSPLALVSPLSTGLPPRLASTLAPEKLAPGPVAPLDQAAQRRLPDGKEAPAGLHVHAVAAASCELEVPRLVHGGDSDVERALRLAGVVPGEAEDRAAGVEESGPGLQGHVVQRGDARSGRVADGEVRPDDVVPAERVGHTRVEEHRLVRGEGVEVPARTVEVVRGPDPALELRDDAEVVMRREDEARGERGVAPADEVVRRGVPADVDTEAQRLAGEQR